MDMTVWNAIWPEWQFKNVIGRGAYGVVYRAVRMLDGQEEESAIKVVTLPPDEREIDQLRAEGMTEEETRNYYASMANEFYEEIQTMKILNGNVSIVNVQDSAILPCHDSPGWNILIRMECLTPFTGYIDGRELTEAEAIGLGIDICRALEVCEQHKILHRDIKPENIFVDKEGHFKLGDFGIARQLELTTAAYTRIGTPFYSAPEVADGKRYDRRADIYSLGLVLYRLLNNGRLPFMPEKRLLTPGDRRTALERRLSGEALPAPANASPELAAVVCKAASPKPKDRYEDAASFRADLERVRQGIAVPWWQKRGVRVAGILLALFLAGGAALLFTRGSGGLIGRLFPGIGGANSPVTAVFAGTPDPSETEPPASESEPPAGSHDVPSASTGVVVPVLPADSTESPSSETDPSVLTSGGMPVAPDKTKQSPETEGGAGGSALTTDPSEESPEAISEAPVETIEPTLADPEETTEFSTTEAPTTTAEPTATLSPTTQTTEPRTTRATTATEPRTTKTPATTVPKTTTPTTAAPMTTETPTTVPRTTEAPTTVPRTTEAPTTVPRTTEAPTTVPRTTEAPTTVPRTTEAPTTVPRTTEAPTTVPEPTEHVHSYGDWVVTREPTCTEGGNRIRMCRECGDMQSEMLAPLGHSYGDWAVSAPTCLQDGHRERSCSRCGDTQFEDLECLGHSLADGTCTRCGACLYRYEVSADGTEVHVVSGGDPEAWLSDEYDVTIPASHNGLPVTVIEGDVFYGLYIRTLTLPSTIHTIREWAFGSTHIGSATIPPSVTTARNAFSEALIFNLYLCEGTAGLLKDAGIEEVYNLYLPDSMTEVSLEEYGFGSIRSVYLGASLSKVSGLGKYRPSLVCVPSSNPYFRTAETCLIENSSGTLVYAFAVGEYRFPEGAGIKIIGSKAVDLYFPDECHSFVVPDGVTEIKSRGITGDWEKLSLPASLKKLGSHAIEWDSRFNDHVIFRGTMAQWNNVKYERGSKRPFNSSTVTIECTDGSIVVDFRN